MHPNHRQFAEMCGVSRENISALVRRGKLEITGRGRINISKPKASAYLEKQMEKLSRSDGTQQEERPPKTKTVPPTTTEKPPVTKIKDPIDNKTMKSDPEIIIEDADNSKQSSSAIKVERPAHLFKPGQSGNPGGAPRGKRWATMLNEMLNGKGEHLAKEWGIELPEGSTIQQALVKKMVAMALSGNEAMIKLIMERMDGKPVQGIAHLLAGDESIMSIPNAAKEIQVKFLRSNFDKSH